MSITRRMIALLVFLLAPPAPLQFSLSQPPETRPIPPAVLKELRAAFTEVALMTDRAKWLKAEMGDDPNPCYPPLLRRVEQNRLLVVERYKTAFKDALIDAGLGKDTGINLEAGQFILKKPG